MVALDNGWNGPELDEWAAISNGTLKYLSREAFEKACSQMDAWVSILEGVPFHEASNSLLPDKYSELAQSQQTVLALEQLLVALNELVRIQKGLQGRLLRWGPRLGTLAHKQINVKDGFKCALESMRTLSRNVVVESVLRKVSLALSAK
jgi:hypothetical protein